MIVDPTFALTPPPTTFLALAFTLPHTLPRCSLFLPAFCPLAPYPLTFPLRPRRRPCVDRYLVDTTYVRLLPLPYALPCLLPLPRVAPAAPLTLPNLLPCPRCPDDYGSFPHRAPNLTLPPCPTPVIAWQQQRATLPNAALYIAPYNLLPFPALPHSVAFVLVR